MTIITIQLDKNLIKQCEQIAKQRNITLNELIVEAITEFINKEKRT